MYFFPSINPEKQTIHTITTSERQCFSNFYVFFGSCTLILGRCVCSMCPSCCVHMGICVCTWVSGLLVCSPKPWRSSARWLHFSCVQVWSTNSCTSTLISCHSRWEYIVYTRPNPSHTHQRQLLYLLCTHTQTNHPETNEWFQSGRWKGEGSARGLWQVTNGFRSWLEMYSLGSGWTVKWVYREPFHRGFLIPESKMSDMLLKFKWLASPVLLNLTAWIWMERHPPSDSCLIFMRGDLMNYPNVCTDLYLRLSNQETNCSVMRGIHVGSGWALNVILGSIPTRPF